MRIEKKVMPSNSSVEHERELALYLGFRMWTPADIDALPSAKDVEPANNAINELEELLKATVEAFEQARLQIVNLEKELKARRAWLAPIRKLPVELLSEIFIHSSRMKRFMPVTITEVSRRWRRVVLSTPKAWSFLKFRYSGNYDRYLSIFMERSNACALHIGPGKNGGYDGYHRDTKHPLLYVVQSAVHRISCLYISAFVLLRTMDDILPNLTRLSLMRGYGTINPHSFNRSKFPRLRYLNSDECDWDFSADSMHLLPPLEYLIIDYNGSSCVDIIEACRTTLRGVELKGLTTEGRQSGSAAIHFPRLEYLGIRTWSSLSTLPFQATTPVLRSYEEMGSFQPGQGILHEDVKNVTHLRIRKLAHLRPFISLRVLQLWAVEPLLGQVDELWRHSEICPTLELIEFQHDATLETTKMKVIEQMIKAARPRIQVIFCTRWSELPGSRHEFEVSAEYSCVLGAIN